MFSYLVAIFFLFYLIWEFNCTSISSGLIMVWFTMVSVLVLGWFFGTCRAFPFIFNMVVVCIYAWSRVNDWDLGINFRLVAMSWIPLNNKGFLVTSSVSVLQPGWVRTDMLARQFGLVLLCRRVWCGLVCVRVSWSRNKFIGIIFRPPLRPKTSDYMICCRYSY